MKGIRSVLFDMGNVLIDYTPELYARRFTRDDNEAHVLTRALFYGPEWRSLDRGDIDISEALKSVKERIPKSLHPAAEETIEKWHEHIVSRPRMTSLVKTVKERGFKVFLLSNASVQFSLYRDRLPVMALMDGLVVSAFERMVKPEPGIYRLFSQRYGLALDECLFIDDMEENAEGARAAGMRAYCFADQDEEKLNAALRAYGILE